MGISEAVVVLDRSETRAVLESERPLPRSRFDQLMEIRIDMGRREWDSRCENQRAQFRKHPSRERPQSMWVLPAMKRRIETEMLSIAACILHNNVKNVYVVEMP